MSDAYFDAMRDAGTYPPKGYGWKTEEGQRAMVERYIKKGWIEPWVVDEARIFGIECPEPKKEEVE